MFNILKLFFGDSVFSRGSVSTATEDKIKQDWENINQLLKQKSPSQLRQALLTADRSFDAALKDFMPGETMGERLKNAKTKFDIVTYNKIWEAHKVRNNLVHEAGYEPPYYVIIQAVENFRNAFKEINIRV